MNERTYARGLICELADENKALRAKYERLKYDVFNLLEQGKPKEAEVKLKDMAETMDAIYANDDEISDLKEKWSI